MRDKIDKETEQAIMLTFLEMPEFRQRARLPLRVGGSTYEEIGRVLGVSRERASAIGNEALRKLRRVITPELMEELWSEIQKED